LEKQLVNWKALERFVLFGKTDGK